MPEEPIEDLKAEQAPADVERDEDYPLVPNHINDWFLQQLIELAEMGIEQPVTLSIGGSHLAGRLIGGDRYFEELARVYEGVNFPEGWEETKEVIVKLFRGHGDIYPKTAEDRLPFGTSRPNYIHLRDARWYSLQGDRMPANGTYWRGKVSAVDGYAIGELKIDRS